MICNCTGVNFNTHMRICVKASVCIYAIPGLGLCKRACFLPMRLRFFFCFIIVILQVVLRRFRLQTWKYCGSVKWLFNVGDILLIQNCGSTIILVSDLGGDRHRLRDKTRTYPVHCHVPAKFDIRRFEHLLVLQNV